MSKNVGHAPARPDARRKSDDEAELRRVAEAVAFLIDSPHTPRPIYEALVDQVVLLSEDTSLYIFAPDVVRLALPLMCQRAEALERERMREDRRRRREQRAVKSKPEPAPAETDSVN